MHKETQIETLRKCWEDSPYPSLKITSYFPAYVELFAHLVGQKCVFIETGILDGGSLFMWKKWLGPNARIIGIDLNPEAVKWREHGFDIFIGDQGDPEFWKNTLSEIGEFDVLLDDGGHQSFQQMVTVSEVIKAAQKKCVVVIEDTATSFMKDFSRHGNHTFLEYCKDVTDLLTARSAAIYPKRFIKRINQISANQFQNVYKMQFYNGIVAFHLNSEYSESPVLIRNRPASKASDFRYEGKNEAKINWPSIFDEKSVTVHGGYTFKARVQKLLKSLRPFNKH